MGADVQRAFELTAAWPVDKQPLKFRGDDLSIVLDIPSTQREIVFAVYQAGDGKNLRLLIEVTDAPSFGVKQK